MRRKEPDYPAHYSYVGGFSRSVELAATLVVAAIIITWIAVIAWLAVYG